MSIILVALDTLVFDSSMFVTVLLQNTMFMNRASAPGGDTKTHRIIPL